MKVLAVTPDGIAGKSDLKVGDTIVNVGEEPVSDTRELLAEFRDAVSEEEVVTLVVERGSARVEVQLRP